jgi:enterochelin esterase-like enzyme
MKAKSLLKKKWIGLLILSTPLVMIVIAWVLYATIAHPPYKSATQHTAARVLPDADVVTIASRPQTPSTIEEATLPFNEKTTRTAFIYLPPNYGSSSKDYPVIYLLHGAPGRADDWIVAGDIKHTLDEEIANGVIPPTLAVFPDGNGGLLNDTQFIDSADHTQLNETFITKTLINYVDEHYRTRHDKQWRAIGGASSGGFGALNIGLKHQDLFGYIISLSGYGKIQKNIQTNRVIQGSQTVIDQNSPITYLPTLTQKDSDVLLISAEGEKFYPDNKSLATQLTTAGFTNEFQHYSGMHGWIFWTIHMYDGLKWLGQSWQT